MRSSPLIPPLNSAKLQAFSEQHQSRMTAVLLRLLPGKRILPTQLHQAMHYSVMGGGKRIRPLLVYATGQACNTPPDAQDIYAAAVEFIHTYSLIHDDLPAMDDDDLRRGQPTCHIKFGEAEAILAGDALQALAFKVIADAPMGDITNKQKLTLINLLAQASGSRGMVGGQSIDLASTDQSMGIAELEDMHIHKTGALIRASVLGAYQCCPIQDTRKEKALNRYAEFIGLAFQIQDDILDVTGDTGEMGKTSGADVALNKPTYVSLLGLSEARQRVQELHTSAIDQLALFSEEADPLRWLSAYIISRNK
ncbi:MAG: farnesyl diphosphate synthase [Gammaproteobacteria bacterium]